MKIDPGKLRGRAIYRLMTSAIVPRPIAWVGSRSPDGADNLAPFSYFMGVSSRPPALAISVARAGRDRLKDTARNILETRVFTVSIASVARAGDLHASSAPWPPEVSETEALGMEIAEGDVVAAPRPLGVPVTMECRLLHALDLGTTHLLVGEVALFHVAREVLIGPPDEPEVRLDALDPLARVGREYASLGEVFALPPATVPEEEADH